MRHFEHTRLQMKIWSLLKPAYMALIISLGVNACQSRPDPVDSTLVADESLPEVKVRQLATKTLYDPLWFGGYLRPLVDYQMVTEKAGTVLKRYVNLGDQVSKGQRLMDLRPDNQGLDYRTYIIRAPMSGIVSQVAAEPGQYLKQAQTALSLADTSAYYVDILGSYEDSLTLEVNSSVQAAFGVGTKKETLFTGKVAAVSPSADPKTGFYPIRVRIRCQDQKQLAHCRNLAKIGSFVKVLFKSSKREAIQISSSEFSRGQNEVFVYKDDGTVETRSVKTGQVISGKFEITEGLKVGEWLIVSYKQRPKAGQTVSVVKDQAISKSQEENQSSIN
ncbi:efflux RND transporter periplasmic adaptor subunit [Pseudobacteriovorax antillogorgiicola]|uniref:RND family efflux transporter, MFP subunit n=1 Tax=Pseudobacteriovorax antillogorgiicola TaxID=1513793 RepID=A0A1Y6CPY8_9BACT|nr:HlyD family efflux transporter periplasmic adaptor subunit [Pseudobacteriovorax antillogorgiicola]TCS42838.1 RND family efflux transporter MFP subunit [Pseudobacteriovorax antillogorgiicola]SMF81785.1 RND family efflux transporter, MFP subunit [Pseudobacteriovorax antillogorgiicola]